MSQLNAMFQATREGMAVLDAEGQVLRCNAAYARIVGRPMMDIPGVNCCDFSCHGVHLITSDTFCKMKEDLRREEFEVQAGQRWFRVTLDPILGEDGRLLGAAQVIRDITPRKEAEEALRLSEEKFSKAFQGSPDWIVISTVAEGRYLEVNPAFSILSGYTKAEVIGKTALELGIWVDPSERMQMVRALQLHGSVLDLEVRFRMKSGEIRTMLWSAEPIHYGGEECLIAVARDITERKKKEEELRDANQALRAIIEAAPLAIFSLDAEGRVKSWNPAAQRIFGWREDEVLGMPLPIVPEESQEQFRSLRERVLKGEMILNVELRRRRKDGSPIDIKLCGAPLRDPQGRVDSIMAIVDDISERKVMEQKVLQAKQEWERTFDSVRDFI
ncbi:MAG: PAS domain S-box protein, partial [Thermodesulfobacteriota bacterium]